MTLSAIRDELETLFINSSLTVVTPKAYSFDLIQLVKAQIGSLYAAKMMHNAQINFVQYTLLPKLFKSATTAEHVEYSLIVTYVREVDIAGDNYHAVTDYYETFYSAIDSVLGKTWNNTIIGYLTQEQAPQISLDFLHDKNVWASQFEITAFV